MSSGKIGVTSDNLFPIIKKSLYSDHDIFLREIVSNAVDAIQKLKVLSSKGEYPGDMSGAKVRVVLNKKKKTLTVSDDGIGMTGEEVEKYINQIAFSGANEFLEKYKDDVNAIIGHFGLGFYSSFMVSSKVEIITRSWQEGAKAVKWSCEGNPEYILEETERETVGTDVIMHINKESAEFLEEQKISEILGKYCKFLPVPILFGKKKEWKEGKEVETEEDNQINETTPAWTRKPADLTDEDYLAFYRKLYPMADEPLFNIHLNVDYPFNLTGILYFPRIKNNLEVQKNKIQLYSNQVFVTDSVEGIVPDFLTLLHGVLDSPDIPLNVSRSYLQSDSNVKKISAHITKKVADRLQKIFKEKRDEFEKKWDNLKIFIEYGMLTEEKFNDRAESFFLLKNTEGKYFTLDEYEKLIKETQTDKDKNLIYLYTNHAEEQYTFVEAARSKGYDVLVMDDILSTPLINKLEQKYNNKRFTRVDADVIEHLIRKDDGEKKELSWEEKQELSPVFQAVAPENGGVSFIVDFKDLGEEGAPMVVTRNEWMRRMKDMSQFQQGMSFYGDMPESLNLVVNISHPLVRKVLDEKDQALGETLNSLQEELKNLKKEEGTLEKITKGKKEEEMPVADKERLEEVRKSLSAKEEEKRNKLKEFGRESKLAKQLVDLALLANGLLKGADLDKFVKRSVELIR
ncbi:MAG TPA: molecular chaperone HtpG [Prolixibacteraceae bacterium]|jgi:molecular chaperone HtpG|nr:molecular chaperone HtpG [Bacteroidales bacterium]OQB81175.1 MAG: Chaperone protein HtpG [Bacteroidetes bacterium ADurb.Bin123]HOC86081.1 molecular chaperone HtpG [Prolixibacteraceae bacterium]HOG95754.1 molecular chaperone HtpG [Prolixibacteraceae bacterium]HPN76212.1 molecular chaperone HtpG [Prolixibacteraceae bacterium]